MFVRRQSSPWLALVGLWYLIGFASPSAVLVQVGFQSHADRYTYLPSIGLGLALVWCVAARCSKSSPSRPLALWPLLMMLRGLGSHSCSSRLWQGSEPLFDMRSVTQGNFMAHQGLAEAFCPR